MAPISTILSFLLSSLSFLSDPWPEAFYGLPLEHSAQLSLIGFLLKMKTEQISNGHFTVPFC
ncbi:hypothetical protein E5676_scaffold360G00710 [Cucumis melo var. makuwa]|uniref:Uncharacterized protein n=1 Tax=Cucumis melo var. makuwa TaxID=1194695 RepID=A0A5D3BP26_CUCMM|nr:hypothetical protein E6C27_scaffold147G00310 [Cucumis melo var. makuwa]TYK00026.1 hypothetical protein E5676_scaffold360G00710 [Cucumis melo var. makuwa]